MPLKPLTSRRKLVTDFIVKDFFPNFEESIQTSWLPEAGIGFQKLSERMRENFEKTSTDPSRAFNSWTRSIFRTAARCSSPEDILNSSTQLVVGRVQAGKTSSFTGLIRLQADNDYKLFFVIAGTSTNLRDQTSLRLDKDLQDTNDFEFITTGPEFDVKTVSERLERRLNGWSDANRTKSVSSWGSRNLVFVILKSTTAHLSAINEMLTRVSKTKSGEQLLNETPTLIIDDECDQASPNGHTSDENKKFTAIYKEISKLRKLVGFNSYVGYTATPYANILMGLESQLRPEKVTVLDPGTDYLDGSSLFLESDSYARVIEDWDFDQVEIPESLKFAFAQFVIQVAIFNSPIEIRQYFLKEPFLKATFNTSQTATMLVHPHQFVRYSDNTSRELKSLQDDWLLAMASFATSDRVDAHAAHIWKTYFQPNLDDFAKIHPDIFSDLEYFKQLTLDMLRELRIIEVVGKGDPFPDPRTFNEAPAWVLVGGVLLDRGQTLPNLLNTYMPRPSGGKPKDNGPSGQVDTLQQRGRFFGHRKTYETLLRGWFDQGALTTYKEIARLDPAHFELLTEVDQSDLPLGQLPIVLALGKSPSLKLLRKNVIPKEVFINSRKSWFARQLDYQDGLQKTYSDLIDEFVIPWGGNSNSLGNDTKKIVNIPFDVPVESAINLLKSWPFSEQDKKHFLNGTELIKHAKATVVRIVLMGRTPEAPHSKLSRDEFRSISRVIEPAAGETWFRIKQLPSSNDAKSNSPALPTIQIHFLDVIQDLRDNLQINSTGNEFIPIKNVAGLTLSFPDAQYFDMTPNGENFVFRKALTN